MNFMQDYDGRVVFRFTSASLGDEGAGPVIPLPGCVEDGGSLAGNDISNSSESSRSSSFLTRFSLSFVGLCADFSFVMVVIVQLGRSSVTHAGLSASSR
jgi:hypothetical protein